MLLLATALPLGRFGHSLWSDEATSVWFAQQPLSALLTALCDPHPPGYYLLLKLWLYGGDSEAWLRTLSLIAAGSSALLLLRFGRDLTPGAPHVGTLAALLLVTQPMQVWYAAEVRMYMLAQVLGLGMVMAAWRWLEHDLGSRRLALAYTVLGILAFAADFGAVFPFGIAQALWLARARPWPWAWLGAQVVVLAVSGLLWLGPGQWETLRQSYHAVFLAVQARRLGLDLSPETANGLLRGGLLAAFLAGWLLAWWWPRLRERLRAYPWWLPVVAMWVALLILAAVPRLYSLKRQLVVLLPFAALLTALALRRQRPLVAVALPAAGLLLTAVTLVQPPREPWREVITAEMSRLDADTVVWVDDLVWPAVVYYTRRMGWTEPPAGVQLWIGARLPEWPAVTPPPGGELWMLTMENPYRNLVSLLPASFAAEYALIAAQHRDGIGFWRWQRRVEPLHPPPSRPTPPPEAGWGLLLPSPLASCPPSGLPQR
ncbi:MAG: hypothetical protein N2383_07025 [Caldilineales bacterium]|nr:hypothetical protein [Caldilineales bacterium]